MAEKPINKPMMLITHVIFDMDGLILDTEKLYEKAYRNLLKSYGKTYPFELRIKVMGRSGQECSKILINELNLPLTPEEFNKKIEQEYLKIFSGPIEIMPGVERVIKHLHRKQVPIAVATSCRKLTFKLKTKEYLDLFKLFDHILLASDDPEVKNGKPAPDPYIICAKRFKNPPINPSKVLVLEDSINGIKAANDAGMISIWIPDSSTKNLIIKKDKSIKPYLTLNSLEEFQPELFGLPPFDD